MSTALPKNVVFNLKSRNASIKSRHVVSLPPSSGVGTYSGDNGGNREIEFAYPSANATDPRTNYLRTRITLGVTNNSGANYASDFNAMLDSLATSILDSMNVNTGDNLRLETINNVFDVALFNVRAKSESWRYNQARRLLAFAAGVDENLHQLSDTIFGNEIHAVLRQSGLNDTETVKKEIEVSIPLCLMSGFFSTSNILPLKYFNTHGGAALRVDFRLRTSNQACVVCTNAGASIPNFNVSYSVDSLNIVYDELILTEAYDMSLKEMIQESGSDGLKIFYNSNIAWSTSIDASGSEINLQIPIYEFSIRHLVAWFRINQGAGPGVFNVSKWSSAGVTSFQTGFSSYIVPSTPITFYNPASTNSKDGKNNARGYMELSKLLGKNGCSEYSSGFTKYDITCNAKSGSSTVVDDAYHRAYGVNYDDPNNLATDSVEVVSGHDNRQSASPAQITFRRDIVAPYNNNYVISTYISADRLCSITADRGLLPGSTA